VSRDYYQLYGEAELAKGYWNPAFALWRAYEAEALSAIPFEQPILDLGCGDGTLARLVLAGACAWGIDLGFEDLKKAVKLKNYALAIQSDAAHLPFPDAWFGSVMSNSAVEHMHQCSSVIHEVYRILRPGGVFAFTVPSHLYGDYLFTNCLLQWIGQKRLADAFVRRKNKRVQHVNLHSPDEWRRILETCGFELVRADYILAKSSCWLWEWPHTLFSWLQPIIHQMLRGSACRRVLARPLLSVSSVTFGQAYWTWRDATCGANLFLLAQRPAG